MRTEFTSSIMQVTQTVEFPARVTITPIPSDIPKPEIVDESEDEFYNLMNHVNGKKLTR